MRTLIFITMSFVATSQAWWFDQQSQSDQALLWEAGKAPDISAKSHSTFILTCWNIYKGGMDGLYSDLEQILTESDFVLMQEFLLNSEQEAQIQRFPHSHWAFAKSFQDGGEWTGVATASQWQPYESVPIRSPGTEPFAGTPKMSLITKYKLNNGSDLWLVNLHGLNFNLGHQDFKDQVKAVADILKTHSGPMIFAGDFNTWAEERFEYLMDITQSLGLERADLENPIGFTSSTLDHIFYRGFSQVKPSLMDQVTSSDHNPLRLEFTL